MPFAIPGPGIVMGTLVSRYSSPPVGHSGFMVGVTVEGKVKVNTLSALAIVLNIPTNIRTNVALFRVIGVSPFMANFRKIVPLLRFLAELEQMNALRLATEQNGREIDIRRGNGTSDRQRSQEQPARIESVRVLKLDPERVRKNSPEIVPLASRRAQEITRSLPDTRKLLAHFWKDFSRLQSKLPRTGIAASVVKVAYMPSHVEVSSICGMLKFLLPAWHQVCLRFALRASRSDARIPSLEWEGLRFSRSAIDSPHHPPRQRTNGLFLSAIERGGHLAPELIADSIRLATGRRPRPAHLPIHEAHKGNPRRNQQSPRGRRTIRCRRRRISERNFPKPSPHARAARGTRWPRQVNRPHHDRQRNERHRPLEEPKNQGAQHLPLSFHGGPRPSHREFSC
jgi:hypothetical protein